jgi:hypothetical protein
MNNEQVTEILAEFSAIAPIMRQGLKLKVSNNYLIWRDHDSLTPEGECFCIEGWPFVEEEPGVGIYCKIYLTGEELFQRAKKTLEKLVDPTRNFKNPLLKAESVKLSWYEDFWDGPLCGVCEWKGKKYWFSNLDPHLRAYQYSMREISDDEWKVREQIHSLYQQHVGTHRDYFYDENGQEIKIVGPMKPKEEWSKYFNFERPPIPESKNPVSAWFVR